MITRLPKENCCHCQKSIKIGFPHFECSNCNRIFHAKCFKSSESEIINEDFYCTQCKILTLKKYNPFKIMTSDDPNESDPHIQKLSDILDNCKQVSIKDLNLLVQPYKSDDYGSFIFQNIDGNKTNFDALSLELQRVDLKFQVIGLAETNISTEESSVYQLEGYNPFYQDGYPNKAKGTGVAMYIKSNLNAVAMEDLSCVTKNLEILFVKIQHEQPLHVGVVYRPPGGNTTEALAELKKIMESCPKMNTYLLGDFNIDLHDVNSKLVQEYENLTLGLNFSPVISTYTHEKPGCKKTCIDNIFTNSIESSVCSGTYNTCITHHQAIFYLFISPLKNINVPDQRHVQYYDYCNSNIDKFVESLEDELIKEAPRSFREFSNIFSDQLDRACKLEQPKCSKRTALNNPWITGGLIASINRKHELYGLWNKSKKLKCLLDPKLMPPDCQCDHCKCKTIRYLKYKKHRTLLNHLINCAKRKYTSGKIDECAGDSRRTWEIINNLRGKKKREMKPNFIINNERIVSRRIIANEFNKYFASIASNLNKAYSEDHSNASTTPSFTDYMPKSCPSSIYLANCDSLEINEIINELKMVKQVIFLFMLSRNRPKLSYHTL